jgi:hypothetical protein
MVISIEFAPAGDESLRPPFVPPANTRQGFRIAMAAFSTCFADEGSRHQSECGPVDPADRSQCGGTPVGAAPPSREQVDINL